MKTANANKLKIKDIITVVLLALINVVIFFASSFLYATPVTIILMPVFFALLEGIVYFIIGTKVKKPGAILIYSVVRAVMENRLWKQKGAHRKLHHQSGVCRFRKHCDSLRYCR